MRPAGFYKGLGVITTADRAWLRKVLKKMNVGDLYGMTLERYFETVFFLMYKTRLYNNRG